MDCPDCDRERVAFAVPAKHAAHLPWSEPAAGICPRCLALGPVATEPAGEPAFDRLGASFPTEPDAGVPMAILLGLLPRLALYRAEITALLEAVERAGTDPLLVLDRLADEPDVETDLELQRRRAQLTQLL